MKDSILFNQVKYAVLKKRLENELKYHQELLEKTKPDNVEEKDNVFRKLYKNAKNSINNGSYSHHLEMVDKISNLLKETQEEAKKGFFEISDEDIKSYSEQLFMNDAYELEKTEFLIDIVLDQTIIFENDKKSFEEISLSMGLKKDCLAGMKSDIENAYQKMSYSKEKMIKDVALVSSIIFVPFVTAGVFAYTSFNEEDKKKLKEYYQGLPEREFSLSISKTALLIKQISKFRKEDERAEKIYESIIDEYMDLKSDNDITMFMSKDNEKNIRRNEIFHNADIFISKVIK